MEYDPTTTLSSSTAGEVFITVIESPTRHHADAVQFIAPTKISTDSRNCTPGRRTHGEAALPIDADEEYAIAPNPPPKHLFIKHQRILDLLYVGAIVVMYPSLAQLAQLKFQNNEPSPFESHSVLAYMAVVAYIIAIPTSVILFSTRPYIENITKAQLSRRTFIYIILKSTLCFSGILAPLSPVLVILLPKGFTWIGYLVVFVLFVSIIAFNFDDYKKLLGKNNVTNLGIDQRDETNLGVDQLDDSSPHSIVTISE